MRKGSISEGPPVKGETLCEPQSVGGLVKLEKKAKPSQFRRGVFLERNLDEDRGGGGKP